MGGPATAEEWAGAIRLLHTMLGIDERRFQALFNHAIIEVFIDVRDIEAATQV